MGTQTIYAGYRGIATITGVSGSVRFADANITAKQEVVAPDLIMGDWDHDAYYYGPIEVGGTISGPITELFVAGAGGLWTYAVKRNGTCGTLNEGEVNLYYYCGSNGGGNNSRKFTGMVCNSVTISCAAGDVSQFSMDLMGKSAGAWASADPPLYTTPEKLITWDKVTVAVSGTGPGASSLTNVNYSNFEVTISNNCEPVFSLSQANLFPVQIVPGLRTITGSLSVYNTPSANGVDTWGDYVAANVSTLTITLGTLSIPMKVQFHRIEPASSVGPVISTLGFTGVTHQAAPFV